MGKGHLFVSQHHFKETANDRWLKYTFGSNICFRYFNCSLLLQILALDTSTDKQCQISNQTCITFSLNNKISVPWPCPANASLDDCNTWTLKFAAEHKCQSNTDETQSTKPDLGKRATGKADNKQKMMRWPLSSNRGHELKAYKMQNKPQREKIHANKMYCRKLQIDAKFIRRRKPLVVFFPQKLAVAIYLIHSDPTAIDKQQFQCNCTYDIHSPGQKQVNSFPYILQNINLSLLNNS